MSRNEIARWALTIFCRQRQNASSALHVHLNIARLTEVVVKNPARSRLDERLAKAAACLESLDQYRISHADPNFGRSLEKGLIWDELLDLELQEFDEEMSRLSEIAPNLVPDARTATQAGGEFPQHPQAQNAFSPWWRLGRLFR